MESINRIKNRFTTVETRKNFNLLIWAKRKKSYFENVKLNVIRTKFFSLILITDLTLFLNPKKEN